MSVDIATNTAFGEQVHIVLTCQQAHIIDLWHTRSKELNRACQQIVIVITSKGIVKCAVHLVQIEIGGCCASGHAALSITVGMDFFHQGIQFF